MSCRNVRPSQTQNSCKSSSNVDATLWECQIGCLISCEVSTIVIPEHIARRVLPIFGLDLVAHEKIRDTARTRVRFGWVYIYNLLTRSRNADGFMRVMQTHMDKIWWYSLADRRHPKQKTVNIICSYSFSRTFSHLLFTRLGGKIMLTFFYTQNINVIECFLNRVNSVYVLMHPTTTRVYGHTFLCFMEEDSCDGIFKYVYTKLLFMQFLAPVFQFEARFSFQFITAI